MLDPPTPCSSTLFGALHYPGNVPVSQQEQFQQAFWKARPESRPPVTPGTSPHKPGL